MSAASRARTWERLAAAGLVHGEPPPSTPRSPWYVRVMQGGSGWLGALFLLGFAGGTFAFLFEDDLGALVGGLIACVAAALTFRRWPDSDFAGQLAFATSLAGQALVAVGLWGLLDERLGPVAALMAAFLVALWALVPGYLHRTWTAWTAAFWGWLALLDAGLGPLVPGLYAAAFAWVWLSEPELVRHGDRVQAAGWGLALAVAQFPIAGWAIGDLIHLLGTARTPLLSAAISAAGLALPAAVLLGVVARLLARERASQSSGPAIAALGGAAVLALMTLKAPGLAPAVILLVVGHAVGNRELAGLGVLALLAFLARYYYALHATLLEKSLLMMATGAALLAVYAALRWLWRRREARDDA
ncbi:MAG: DUF4401 domain-containing protein [Gammaproteobacteria bacterium]|nr:DUF4401 domain-containing protein [Gammaproteobacteria bacterium]